MVGAAQRVNLVAFGPCDYEGVHLAVSNRVQGLFRLLQLFPQLDDI